jgi:hypothetical protein
MCCGVYKMKKNWKISIAIGILSLGLILGGFLLLNKPSNQLLNNTGGDNSGEENTGGTEGMPILDALPIFYSNSTIDSMEKALALFNIHFDAMKENTVNTLTQSGKPHDAETINEMVLFALHATVERREWSNDQYWLLPPNKSAYVLVIPAVSKHENWVENESKILVERITNKEGATQTITLPSNATSFEDVKEYLSANSPSGVETYWTETKLWIKYLVDDNGIIYWAGEYLKTKPWLDY